MNKIITYYFSKNIKFTLALLFVFFTLSARGQQAKIVDYATLEKTLKGNSDTLKVVNFWATWCGPCIAEMPHLVKAQEEYKNRKVKFIYVSLDFSKYKDNVEKVAGKKGLKGDLFILKDDPNVYVNKIDKNWEGQIPITLLVLEDGSYKIHNSSFSNFEELNNFIKEHLK